MEGTRLILPLHPKRQAGVPFFMVSGLGGHALGAQVLTSRVPEPWVGQGILYPSFVPEEPPYRTFEDLARRLLEDIMRVQISGPYLFVGYSMGGLLSAELARQVRLRGHRAGLVLVDVKLFDHAPLKPWHVRWPRKAYWVAKDVWSALRGGDKRNRRLATQRRLSHEPGEHEQLPGRFGRAVEDGRAALQAYRLTPVDAPSVLIRCAELSWWDDLRDWPDDYGWGHYTDQKGVLVSPGDHLGMIQGANLPRIGEVIGHALQIVHDATQVLPVSIRGAASPVRSGSKEAHEAGSQDENQEVPQR